MKVNKKDMKCRPGMACEEREGQYKEGVSSKNEDMMREQKRKKMKGKNPFKKAVAHGKS